jgi:protein-disulfide isomerase
LRLPKSLFICQKRGRFFAASPRGEMMLTSGLSLGRRALLAGIAMIGVAASLPAQAQTAPATTPLADLMVAGPLGDRVMGDAKAPVTIVEYASLTCGHCAAFHVETLPEIKTKYVDTGKVRIILREFPFDPLATAASMLARCAPEQRYWPMIDVFFKTQDVWARSERPLDALLVLARQAGFTQETFEACLKNQSVYDGINAAKQRGADLLKVNSTPTFFINGQRVTGNRSVAEMEKLIDAAMPK